jgi:N4-gp56 family major capsid protein
MSANLTTASGGLSGQYQKYFDKRLLTAVLQILVMDQFGQIRSLPPNMGALTVRFTRPDSPDRTQVQTLTEGTPLSTDRNYTYSFVDATCTQVGEKTTISDILGATNLFDTLQNVSKLLGQEAAHYYDFRITTEIIAGTQAFGAGARIYSGGAANYAALKALTGATGKIVIADLLRAFTALSIARAPKASANERAPKARGGDYVAVTPPQVLFDAMQDSKFTDAGTRGTNEGLFTGEMGTWYGVRIIRGTQPWIENATEGTYDGTIVYDPTSTTGSVFSTIAMGSEMFGVVSLASQSITSPKLIVCDKADKSDQLNQLTSVGWKAFFTVKTLKGDWARIIRSKVSYS